MEDFSDFESTSAPTSASGQDVEVDEEGFFTSAAPASTSAPSSANLEQSSEEPTEAVDSTLPESDPPAEEEQPQNVTENGPSVEQDTQFPPPIEEENQLIAFVLSCTDF